MLRGEFLGRDGGADDGHHNGGADFYAKDAKGLQREVKLSLKVFLAACAEDGVEPRWDPKQGKRRGDVQTV